MKNNNQIRNFDYSSQALLPSRVELAEKLLDELKTNSKIALTGVPGIGKTFLCRYIYNNLPNNINALWIDGYTISHEHELNLCSVNDDESTLLFFNDIEALPKPIFDKCHRTLIALKHTKIIATSRVEIDGFITVAISKATNDDIMFLLKAKIPNADIDLTHLVNIADGHPLVGTLLSSLLALNNEDITSKINNYFGKIDINSVTPRIGDLFFSLAKSAYEKGDYPGSLNWYKYICSLLEKSDTKELVVVYNDMANVYQAMGDYDRALEFAEKTLSLATRILSESDSLIATIYNTIGGIHNMKGKISLAEKYYVKSLELREKYLGKEHPDIANSYSNLANIYFEKGDNSKALEMYNKALIIREEILGSTNIEVALTYNNIASVYASQGNYDKALTWYYKTLMIYENVLGTDHPYVATTYNNVADIYANRNNYTVALEWYHKALTIHENSLGTEHPDTAITYNNIASVYMNQFDFYRALNWYEKSYAILVLKLGENHPNTIAVKENLERAKREHNLNVASEPPNIIKEP